MTVKEKAEELFNKYYSYLKANLMNDEEAIEDAKECALIAVDEILKELNKNVWIFNEFRSKYWEEVKREIEKL